MGHSKAFRSAYDEQELHILQMDDPITAIEAIMDTYGDEIKKLIYTYVKNSVDTDDITQEVFITVYEKLHTFQGKSKLRSWIYSIAINKCKDHLRSFHNRQKRLKDKLIQMGRYSFTQHEQTPEQNTIQQSEAAFLIQQITNLPIKYREVILLFYFNDMSTKEISEILEINEATVRTRLARARHRLKHRLTRKRGEADG